jgi:hypothetical protein
MFDLESGWAIETPMGAVIMERLTVHECYYIAYALNKAYPVKIKK